MKYLVLIPDGMADERVEALGNRTPMEAANKPCMDKLASRSTVGLVSNVPDGMVPESDTANMAILSSVEFDEIKFDRSLVSALEENEKSRMVMETTLQLCRAMGKTISLAEGIETAGQLEILKQYQCRCGQGYYFSRPLPQEQFEDFLKEKQ